MVMSEAATSTVKGYILQEINDLELEVSKRWMKENVPSEKAQQTWILHQIRRFKEKPDQFKPAPPPAMPPGQPIGCE